MHIDTPCNAVHSQFSSIVVLQCHCLCAQLILQHEHESISSMQGRSLYKHTPQLRVVGGFPALYTKMQNWVQQIAKLEEQYMGKKFHCSDSCDWTHQRSKVICQHMFSMLSRVQFLMDSEQRRPGQPESPYKADGPHNSTCDVSAPHAVLVVVQSTIAVNAVCHLTAAVKSRSYLQT